MEEGVEAMSTNELIALLIVLVIILCKGKHHED